MSKYYALEKNGTSADLYIFGDITSYPWDEKDKDAYSIVKDLQDITLYDVYMAVDSGEGDLFHFHENPNPACPVGRNIHAVLDSHLSDAQAAMENELKKVTLADLTRQLNQKIV